MVKLTKDDITFSKLEVTDFLKTEEDIQEYLEDARNESNPQVYLLALADVAKLRGMTQVAKKAKMSRAGLYKALSIDGNPSYATIHKIESVLLPRLNYAT